MKVHLTKGEWVKVAGFLAAIALFFWVTTIRPASVEWETVGETRGEVKSLMSNSNIAGPAFINAVVKLEDGSQTILRVPLRSDVRAGDIVRLETRAAKENPSRKQYKFLAEVN